MLVYSTPKTSQRFGIGTFRCMFGLAISSVTTVQPDALAYANQPPVSFGRELGFGRSRKLRSGLYPGHHLSEPAGYCRIVGIGKQRFRNRVCHPIRQGILARTVTIKVRYDDFTTITRSHSDTATSDPQQIARRAVALLEKTEAGRRPVRLLGAGVHNLVKPGDGEAKSESWELPLL